jgi:hypothetical protein
MCTTCVSTASEAVSWGTPALAAGAAAVMTGIRMRFGPRPAEAGTPEPEQAVGDDAQVEASP